MAKPDFLRGRYAEYPLEGTFSMRAGEGIAFFKLPRFSMPHSSNYFKIKLLIGDRITTHFVEQVRPTKFAHGRIVSAEEYEKELGKIGIPLPPDTWTDEGNLFIKSSHIISQIDFPGDPADRQGRLIVTSRRRLEYDDYTGTEVVKTRKQAMSALEAKGFPHPALDHPEIPLTLPWAKRRVMNAARIVGLASPPPDGTLIIAQRSESLRKQDIRETRV